jgi:hypothetical protein
MTRLSMNRAFDSIFCRFEHAVVSLTRGESVGRG